MLLRFPSGRTFKSGGSPPLKSAVGGNGIELWLILGESGAVGLPATWSNHRFLYLYYALPSFPAHYQLQHRQGQVSTAQLAIAQSCSLYPP